jgi:hypothetical protein
MNTLHHTLYYMARLLAPPGITRHWKCEAFASLIFAAGVVAVALSGAYEASQLNPSAAWLGSVVDEDASTCVNITCGGYYCDFAQPKSSECEHSPVHLAQGETAEICTPPEHCDWQARVVVDAAYENRTFSLYIYEATTGDTKTFPQLENLKHQYVDITKYVNSQFGVTRVTWDLQTQSMSSRMESCTTTIPDSRCGAYTLLFDKVIYEMANRQRHTQEIQAIIFSTFLKAWVIRFVLGHCLDWYRGIHAYESQIRGDKDK